MLTVSSQKCSQSGRSTSSKSYAPFSDQSTLFHSFFSSLSKPFLFQFFSQGTWSSVSHVDSL